MFTAVLTWWMFMAPFAACAAVVRYGFNGELLGAPPWAWGLMGGIALAATSQEVRGGSA